MVPEVAGGSWDRPGIRYPTTRKFCQPAVSEYIFELEKDNAVNGG